MSKIVSVVVVLSVLGCLVPGSLQYGQLKEYKKDSENRYVLERIVHDNNNNTVNYYIFPDINAFLESKSQPPTEAPTEPSTQSTNASTCTPSTQPPTRKPGNVGVRPLAVSEKNCYKVLEPENGVRGTPVSSMLFMTFCSDLYAERGWTTVQRRMKGSVSFNRDWNDYKHGFGDKDGDFWIGLDRLNKLSMKHAQELLIVMLDSELNFYFAHYNFFQVDNEAENFALRHVGCYYGTAGDSLSDNVGKAFSTYDRDNGEKSQRHCAQDFAGGWWYYGTLCSRSHLNGVYSEKNNVKAISWDTISPSTSLIYTEMFVKRNCDTI